MDRRNFLRLLIGGAAAAVAPTKAYSFLGGIFRRKQELILPTPEWRPFNIGLIASDWRYSVQIRNIVEHLSLRNPLLDDIPFIEPVEPSS